MKMPTEHCPKCNEDESCGNSHIYVIEFHPDVAEEYAVHSDKGYLYVGSTGKGVLQRFRDNFTRQDGVLESIEYAKKNPDSVEWKYNSTNAKRIRRHYLRHRPDLFYAKINPIEWRKGDSGAPERRERKLADKLRNRGWRVEGPTNKK